MFIKKYSNKYIIIELGTNNCDYWLEFRICGVGIDINYQSKKAGIDHCTNKISSYATYKQRKRLNQAWSSYKSLPLKGKILKWFWLNLGWLRGFHMYEINGFRIWKRNKYERI